MKRNKFSIFATTFFTVTFAATSMAATPSTFSKGSQSQQTDQAIDSQAIGIIQSMAQELRNIDTLTFEGTAYTEEVDSELQKLGFPISLKGKMKRPDGLLVEKSGHENLKMWFDGSTVTVLNTAELLYARIDGPSTINELVDAIEKKGLQTPLAGLLKNDMMSEIKENANSASYIGKESLLDATVHHIAVRQDEVDWQVWIDAETSLPKRIVVTSKMVAAAPEYQLLLTKFEHGGQVSADTFEFQAPKGAREVDLRTLSEPAGAGS